MTETLTIARIGQEKVIEYLNKKKKTAEHPDGTPDSFKKVGVLTNEHGEKWFDLTFRGEVPVEVGKQYEFEVSEREYNGKTYYDIKLPKKGGYGGGASAADIAKELYQLGNTDRVLETRRLNAIWTKLGVIEGLLRGKDEPLAQEFKTPEDAGIVPEDEINPEDIPF